MELTSCHLSGTQKFDVAPRLFENLWTPALTQHFLFPFLLPLTTKTMYGTRECYFVKVSHVWSMTNLY